MKARVSGCMVLLILMLSGCATLKPEDHPIIQVSSLTLLPPSNLSAQIQLEFEIQNPSNRPFPVEGLAYSLSVEGHQLFSGVDRPQVEVPPYSSKTFSAKMSSNMMGLLSLFGDLYQQNTRALNYELKVKLDSGNPLLPAYTEIKKGVLKPLQAQ